MLLLQSNQSLKSWMTNLFSIATFIVVLKTISITITPYANNWSNLSNFDL